MFNKNVYRIVCLIGIILSYVFILFYQSRQIEIVTDVTPLTAEQNTTIYAAYSQDGRVSNYVVDSLKLLKKVSPNIIFITDNPIQRGELRKLVPYVNRIEARRHGEYDWGSYKRGFNWLKQHPIALRKLILANDSVLPITTDLQPIFNKMENQADFWGITANIDGTYHLQSYFLVFSPQVYNHPSFVQYLNQVQKEASGLEVAYRYEVPFTAYLTARGFTSAAYIPYESIKGLELNDKHCYPLTMLSKYHLPFLKMRTFTNRLIVKEPRRLVFQWLRTNAPLAYEDLIMYLEHINSPYLKENR